MQQYIALLRGINVSGYNIIKMEALRAMLAGLGFTGVKTYIQSGNIVFEAPPSTTLDLERQIHNGIQQSFQLDIPVMVIPAREFIDILEQNPLASEEDFDISAAHITVLAHEPVDFIDPMKIFQHRAEDEVFIQMGRTIYLYFPSGYGKTKLSNKLFEQVYKIPATTRNWKTCLAIKDMLA